MKTFKKTEMKPKKSFYGTLFYFACELLCYEEIAICKKEKQIECIVYTLAKCVDIKTAREIANKAYNKVNKIKE